jgi:hypothetical protein
MYQNFVTMIKGWIGIRENPPPQQFDQQDEKDAINALEFTHVQLSRIEKPETILIQRNYQTLANELKEGIAELSTLDTMQRTTLRYALIATMLGMQKTNLEGARRLYTLKEKVRSDWNG